MNLLKSDIPSKLFFQYYIDGKLYSKQVYDVVYRRYRHGKHILSFLYKKRNSESLPPYAYKTHEAQPINVIELKWPFIGIFIYHCKLVNMRTPSEGWTEKIYVCSSRIFDKESRYTRLNKVMFPC